VVGAGNWVIAHDRIGPRVLELIESRYGPDVELCALGGSGLALLDHLHRQELMILVDAGVFPGRAGEIRAVQPDLSASLGRVGSAHQIGPLEAMVIADRLFPEDMPRRLLLIVVQTSQLDDDKAEAACREVVGILDREIEAWSRARPREECENRSDVSGGTTTAAAVD
jgi:hydrogenase maturation protease